MNKTEKQEIVFREIHRMLMPDNLKSNNAHLDLMLDFYFKVIDNSINATFTDQFQAEMSHSFQMMFTKAESFRLSIFIMDYMEVFPETKFVYYSQDNETQSKIHMYCNYFRGKKI